MRVATANQSWFRFPAALALAAALAPGLPAQLEVRGLPALIAIAKRTEASLDDAPCQDSAAVWRHVLGWLRLARAQRARELLLAHTDPDDVCLALAALATYTRCTGDVQPATALLSGYRTRLAALAREPLPESYARACLRVHASCCAALLGDPRQRDERLRAATMRLLRLEAECWQPQREHFRPTRGRGDTRAAEPADCSLWQPLAAGMLLASGDRLPRHLRATLQAYGSGSPQRWRHRESPAVEAALALLAARQVGDRELLAHAHRQLERNPSDHPATLALQLDALLFAITGVRLAAGTGHGERWLRITPWLPATTDDVRIDGLIAQTATLSLHLQRTPKGLAVEVATKSATPVAVVVADRTRQYVTTVAGGAPFRCILSESAR